METRQDSTINRVVEAIIRNGTSPAKVAGVTGITTTMLTLRLCGLKPWQWEEVRKLSDFSGVPLDVLAAGD